MMRALDVYLQRQNVGQLIQDAHGQMLFNYGREWLASENAMPLSYSLPLRENQFTRNECRGFFGGILPEESKRDMVAKNLGISVRNDFAMLYPTGQGRLAPLYDVLCTAYYPELSSTMAMKLGGEYHAEKLFARHFDKLADNTGLSKALVKKRVVALSGRVLNALTLMGEPHNSIINLPDFIAKRCLRVKGLFGT